MTESYNAESAVIGGLLLFSEECSFAADTLTCTDFANPLAAEAFGLISKAILAGQKMDTAIFGSAERSRKTQKNTFSHPQRRSYRPQTTTGCCTVKTESDRRRVTGKLNGLVIGHGGYDELLSSIGRIASEESTRGKGEDNSYLVNYLASFDKPVDPKSRILTGFSKLDKAFHGLRKGSLCYIGAYPSRMATAGPCLH